MFQALATINNRTTISWINGGDAIKVEKWLRNEPPHYVEIGMLPTIIAKGTFPKVDMDTIWTRGTIYLNRPNDPPGPGEFIRIQAPTMKIRLQDSPDFKVKQFFPNGAPFLDYNSFVSPGPMIKGDISLIRVASVDDLKDVSPNKRMYPLPFPGVKPPNLPEPVPAVAGPSTQRVASGTDRGSTSSSAASPAAATPPKIGSRLRRSPRNQIKTKVLQYSPSMSPSKQFKAMIRPKKRLRTDHKVTVDLTVASRDDTDEETNPDHANETIDICDSSQEDRCNPRKGPDGGHGDDKGDGQGGAEGLHT